MKKTFSRLYTTLAMFCMACMLMTAVAFAAPRALSDNWSVYQDSGGTYAYSSTCVLSAGTTYYNQVTSKCTKYSSIPAPSGKQAYVSFSGTGYNSSGKEVCKFSDEPHYHYSTTEVRAGFTHALPSGGVFRIMYSATNPSGQEFSISGTATLS